MRLSISLVLVNIQQPISSALNKRPARIYSKKIADIVPDQVLNLSAFGDIIENPDKPWDWTRISCNPNITMKDIK